MQKPLLKVTRIAILCALIALSLFGSRITPTQAQGITYTHPIITNNFTPDVIPSGGTSVLTVILANSNSFPITLSSFPPAVSEPLPAGVVFDDPVSPTANCGITVTTIGTTLALYGGVIPAASGEDPGTCTVTVNVTSTAAGSTFIYTIPANELVATDSTGTISLTNQTKTDATIQVRTVQPPSLSKNFNPNTRTVGASSQLAITITNTDLNYALHEVTLTDNFPSGVQVFTTPSVSSTNCGSSVTYTDPAGGTLGSGDTGIKIVNADIPINSACIVYVNVTSLTAGAYMNTIPANAISSREGVTNATAASAQVNFQKMGLAKVFSVTNLQVGGTTHMTITLRNYTTGEVFNVTTLTDNLPAGMVPAATPNFATNCTGGSVSYDAGTNSITLTGGTITANGSCTVTADLTVTGVGNFTNTLPVGALHTAEGATNVSAVSASVTTYSTGQGITNPSKSFSPSAIPVDGISRLTITFTAPGDTSLSNFSITDGLPLGVRIANVPNPTKSTYCQGAAFTASAGDMAVSWTGGSIPATRTCTLAVNVTSDTPGTYVNTIPPANVTNTETRTMSGNISSTLNVSGISVSKAYYPNTVNINGISTLTILLYNDNESQIDNAAFTDTLGAGVVLYVPTTTSKFTNCGAGAELSASDGGTTISLTKATIPAAVGGVQGVCRVTVMVRGVTTGSWQNTIARGDLTGTIHSSGFNISNPVAASASITVADLHINVNKSFSPNTVFSGSSSTLTLTLSNPNNAVLTGVAFTDTFPAGMYLAAPALPTTSCGGVVTAVPNATSFSFSGGTIAANSSCLITVKTTMNVINTLTNTIPIGAVTTTNGARNEEQVQASLGNLSLATLYKTFFESPIEAGETTTMQITITNVGNVPLTGLGFVDSMPSGMLPVLPLTTSQCNGGTVSYDSATNRLSLAGGSLAGRASCNILVDVQVLTVGDYQNCLPAGTLTDDQSVTNPSGTCFTLEVNPPTTLTPPAITKVFSPDTIAEEDISSMTFTITNPNLVALTGVAFSDTLPTGMALVSAPNPSQCGGTVSYDSGTNTLALSDGTIAASGSCTVVAGVQADAGVYVNTTSTVSSTNGGIGNTATDTLTVIAAPQISKVFSPDAITATGISTLTFTITNPNPVTNPVDLTGVAFTDDLPTGVVVASDPNITIAGCGVSPVFAPAASDTSISLSGATVAVGTNCVISVDVTADNGGTYVNTTDAVTSTNGGTGNTATDTLIVSGPGLSLVKSHLTASYSAAGDIITYSYLLTNTGDVTITAPITITDDHFATSFTCLAADLHAGASASCTADYSAVAGDVTARAVTNTAYATGDAGGVTVYSNESSTTVPYASLRLVKTTSTVSFHNPGNTIAYTYTLINDGNTTLYPPYVVTDDHFGTTLTCTSTAPLTVGGATTCTRNYTVTATDVTNKYVTNIAHATALDSGGEQVLSNNSSVTVYKVDAPLISKSFAPDPIITGGISTLTVTITNPPQNVVPLTGVAFTDNLPSGMTIITPILASQCGGTVVSENSNTRLRLSGGSIQVGTSCTISVEVTANTGKVYTNTTGTVSSTNGGTGLTATDTLTVVSPAVISKSFNPTTINDGGVSTLTFRVTNPSTNPVPLTGVSFNDVFPTGLEVNDPANVVVTNCGATPSFSPATGATTVSLSGATIAAGTPCVISVDVTAPAGVYVNTSEPVDSNEGGEGLPSNTATLEALATLDLVITKTDGISSVTAGDSVTYTIIAQNNGLIDAIGAKIVDSFPTSLTGVTWTCSPAAGAACTASGSGNISDTVDLPAGASVTYTVTAAVVNPLAINVINTASVIPPAGLVDEDTTNNTSTDTDRRNSLLLAKAASAAHTDYLVLGEEVTYTYTLTNNGTSTLAGPFTVSDDKIGDPKGTLFACGTEISLAPGASTTCTALYTITQDDLDAGFLTNTAVSYAADEDGDLVTSNEAEQTIGADQQPLIGIAKELVGIETVSVGTYDLTFNVLVRNYGNVTLHDVNVTDSLTDTFAVPVGHEETMFSVLSIDGTLAVNSGYNGVSDTELLDDGVTLAPGAEGTVTIVVRVVPTRNYFENSAVASGVSPTDETTTDTSQNGENPDFDGDGDVLDDNVPTPFNFGSKIFDPPTGIKTVDASGRPQFAWTMVWINNSNIVGLQAVVHDPIPDGTTYIATGAPSGYDVPLTAPGGSTNVGVSCTSSTETVTELCYYEGPTPAYLNGRIIWEGTIGPDFMITDPLLATNALTITFNVQAATGVQRLYNRATIDTDLNGDDDYTDTGETEAVAAAHAWSVDIPALPETGFAPYRQTILPLQPEIKQYSELGDLWMEIPSLNVEIPIVGVPQTESGWDVTWLDGQAGWLSGTAFPTWTGNSVLTGHVYDSNGLPGPFINIDDLEYGDTIIVHAWGQEYIYEVREMAEVDSNDTSVITQHEELPWLTLVTCRGYDPTTNSYRYRYVVRAVQIKIK
jgi:LPXTG-site transpeptidase (sortase) family protein